MPMRTLLFLGLMITGLIAEAQFPPPAGQPGSTAIHFDSTCFKFWADSCSVIRGFVNISDTTITYEGQNRAFYGSVTDATGMADEFTLSLGDGGIALTTFPVTIGNGPGFDFAVFENGLGDAFLELGFVEVSSDGLRFVRFPAVTLVQTDTQVSTFGSTDATLINNFAGKYRALYGTPFDLEDIKDSTGIDLNRVTHVRIVDAIGCIQLGLATYDSEGTTVNDPWPTPFHTCGFDLDAIGVINTGAQGVNNTKGPNTFVIYPNPVGDYLSISCGEADGLLTLVSTDGKIIADKMVINRSGRISMTGVPPGLYLCRIVFPDGSTAGRMIMKK
jgi:hypothetical protein